MAAKNTSGQQYLLLLERDLLLQQVDLVVHLLLLLDGVYRLYIGIADGMSIARVWACRYSK